MTEEKEKALKPLTKRQSVFVDEYAISLNGSAAARKAGYSEKTAAAIASENLTKPNIRAAVEARFKERHLSADEAMALLADMARGDIGKFMETTSMGFELDVDAAKKAGLTKLIKRIKQRTEITNGKDGEDKEVHTQEIELYSAKDALETILKVAGKIAPSEINIKVNLTDD